MFLHRVAVLAGTSLLIGYGALKCESSTMLSML